MTNLSKMHCLACRGDQPVVSEAQVDQFMSEVPDWQVAEVAGVRRLVRVFKFRNFAEAIAFTDKVGAIAEQEDHHPLLITEWGKVTVNWWTHKLHGLHQNDFVMAARTDQLFSQAA